MVSYFLENYKFSVMMMVVLFNGIIFYKVNVNEFMDEGVDGDDEFFFFSFLAGIFG